MMRICHVFDRSAGWEQRVTVSQLRAHLPADRFDCHLAAIAPDACALLRSLNQPVELCACLPGIALMAAPSLARIAARRRIDVLHAWGVGAALSSCAVTGTPLVIELFDPKVATQCAKLVRTIARPRGFAVICSSQTVRRRLITGGVPGELCAVIRPGVDFAEVGRYRSRSLRRELAIDPKDFVTIVPEPASRDGGYVDAFMAVKMANLIHGRRHKFIVPGVSREQRRIVRLAAALPEAEVLISPGSSYRFEEILPHADALVVPARGDISTTSIAWAMAANVAVIGSAVYAVAELIANGLNGMLYKQVPGRTMTADIARLLQDHAAQNKAKEAARGHAYEVFGVRHCIEQRVRVYENIIQGIAPSEGVVDSAMAG